jgi:2'-5' RNA ligase
MSAVAELGALVVALPELDGVLGPLLAGTTPGIGPHVTVAVPFPAALTQAGLDALAGIAASVEPWSVDLRETAWFREPHEVLWLRPEPAAPFHALAAAVGQVFADFPVYGGELTYVPHVTIAVAAPEIDTAAAETAVSALLPLSTEARELTLVHVAGGIASAARSWPLGG